MFLFSESTDEEIIAWLKRQNYIGPRKLDDGTWVAINKLMYTWSVCVDMDEVTAYRYRWCFEDINEARHFLATIKEFDEVPVRRNSLKGHRYSGVPLLEEHWPNGRAKW